MVSAVCRQVLIKQKSRRILFFCAYWKLSYSFDVVHSLKKNKTKNITFSVITPFTYLINY